MSVPGKKRGPYKKKPKPGDEVVAAAATAPGVVAEVSAPRKKRQARHELSQADLPTMPPPGQLVKTCQFAHRQTFAGEIVHDHENPEESELAMKPIGRPATWAGSNVGLAEVAGRFSSGAGTLLIRINKKPAALLDTAFLTARWPNTVKLHPAIFFHGTDDFEMYSTIDGEAVLLGAVEHE